MRVCTHDCWQRSCPKGLFLPSVASAPTCGYVLTVNGRKPEDGLLKSMPGCTIRHIHIALEIWNGRTSAAVTMLTHGKNTSKTSPSSSPEPRYLLNAAPDWTKRMKEVAKKGEVTEESLPVGLSNGQSFFYHSPKGKFWSCSQNEQARGRTDSQDEGFCVLCSSKNNPGQLSCFFLRALLNYLSQKWTITTANCIRGSACVITSSQLLLFVLHTLISTASLYRAWDPRWVTAT